MKNLILSLYFLLSILYPILAQTTSVEFKSELWNVENAKATFENFKGQQSLFIRQGLVILKDVEFLNGTLEIDIYVDDSVNFPGIFFRLDMANNQAEQFYIRPHQNGNPDATQYTPIFNNTAGWQLYHGPGYSGQVGFKTFDWNHIKIEVSGDNALIYLNDMAKPIIEVFDLKMENKAGSIGLNTGPAHIHYANFSYDLTDPKISVADTTMPDENILRNWQVSNLVYDSLILERNTVSESFNSSLQWQDGVTEKSGLLNLAKYALRAPGQTTVIARTIIDSDRDQIKKISFGFSDAVRIYCNEKVIYEGLDGYRSRDYRYLGTIGYFDAVYLPLKPGENEIWFVVSENFGGWGIQAKIENKDFLSLR